MSDTYPFRKRAAAAKAKDIGLRLGTDAEIAEMLKDIEVRYSLTFQPFALEQMEELLGWLDRYVPTHEEQQRRMCGPLSEEAEGGARVSGAPNDPSDLTRGEVHRAYSLVYAAITLLRSHAASDPDVAATAGSCEAIELLSLAEDALARNPGGTEPGAGLLAGEAEE